MTPEQKRQAAEYYREAYAAANPRREGESPFVYYGRAILWLNTPEGKRAFADAAQRAMAGQ